MNFVSKFKFFAFLLAFAFLANCKTSKELDDGYLEASGDTVSSLFNEIKYSEAVRLKVLMNNNLAFQGDQTTAVQPSLFYTVDSVFTTGFPRHLKNGKESSGFILKSSSSGSFDIVRAQLEVPGSVICFNDYGFLSEVQFDKLTKEAVGDESSGYIRLVYDVEGDNSYQSTLGALVSSWDTHSSSESNYRIEVKRFELMLSTEASEPEYRIDWGLFGLSLPYYMYCFMNAERDPSIKFTWEGVRQALYHVGRVYK